MRTKLSARKQRKPANLSSPSPRIQLPETFLQSLTQYLYAQQDFSTLCILAQTSKSLHKMVIPYIYDTLVLSRGNAESVFAGLKVLNGIEIVMGKYGRDVGWSESEGEDGGDEITKEAREKMSEEEDQGGVALGDALDPMQGPTTLFTFDASPDLKSPTQLISSLPFHEDDQARSEMKLDLAIPAELASFDFSYLTSGIEPHTLEYEHESLHTYISTPNGSAPMSDPLEISYVYPPTSANAFYSEESLQTPHYDPETPQIPRKYTSDYFEESVNLGYSLDADNYSHLTYSLSHPSTPHSSIIQPNSPLSSSLSSRPSKPRRQPSTRFPNNPSHARKLESLRHVKTLILVTLPSKKTGLYLESWAKVRSGNGKGLLFPNLDTIIIKDQAVYKMAEWSERHTGRMHPFANGLKHATSPKKVCVTYPIMDPELVTRFCTSREALERASTKNKKMGVKALSRKVLIRWFDFQTDGISNTIERVLNGWKVQIDELVLHNVVNQRIVDLEGVRLRVSFKICACAGAGTGCIDHITGIGRMKRMVQLLGGREGDKRGEKIELVNLDAVGMKDLKAHEVAPMLQAGGIQQETMRILHIPRGLDGSLSVACNCCGKVEG